MLNDFDNFDDDFVTYDSDLLDRWDRKEDSNMMEDTRCCPDCLYDWDECECDDAYAEYDDCDEDDGQPDEAQEWYDFDPDC